MATLFDLIDRTEGGGNYSTLFGHSQRQGSPFAGVDVSQMTLDELRRFSDPSGQYGNWVKEQLAKSGHEPRIATPMGRHQIVGSTMNRAAEQMGLSGDTVFGPQVQDAMAEHLARQRLGGAKSIEAKRQALRNEWEGFRGVSNNELDKAIQAFESGSTSGASVREFATRRSRESDFLAQTLVGGGGSSSALGGEGQDTLGGGGQPGMDQGTGWQFDPQRDMPPPAAPGMDTGGGWAFAPDADMPPPPQVQYDTGWQFDPTVDMPASPMVGAASTSDAQYEEAGKAAEALTGETESDELSEEEKRRRRIMRGKMIYQFGVGLGQLFKGEAIDIGTPGKGYLEQYAPEMLDEDYYKTGGTGVPQITPGMASKMLEYGGQEMLDTYNYFVETGDETGARQMLMKIPDLAQERRDFGQQVSLKQLDQEFDLGKMYQQRDWEVSDDLRNRDWANTDWGRDIDQADREWERQRTAQLTDQFRTRGWQIDDREQAQFIQDKEALYLSEAMKLGGEDGQKFLSSVQAAPSTQKAFSDLAYNPDSMFAKAVQDELARNPEGGYSAAYQAVKKSGAQNISIGDNLEAKDNIEARKVITEDYIRPGNQRIDAMNADLAEFEAINNDLLERGAETGAVSEAVDQALSVAGSVIPGGDALTDAVSDLIGVSREEVEGMTALQQRLAYMIARENKGQGSITEQERAAMLKQMPNLLQTSEGRRVLINKLQALNALEQAANDEFMARAYSSDNTKHSSVLYEDVNKKYRRLGKAFVRPLREESQHINQLDAARRKLGDDAPLSNQELDALYRSELIESANNGEALEKDQQKELDAFYKKTLPSLNPQQAADIAENAPDALQDGWYWDTSKNARVNIFQ